MTGAHAWRSRTTPRDDSGAAAVEFALVVPFVLLLLFGVIDFGRAYNMQLSLTHAAREGARVAALGGSSASATSRTQSTAAPVTGVSVSVTSCPASVLPASDAVVTASRTYNYITPISGILNIMGQPALAAPAIQGTGRMRCNG
jgi:Flp pilus assembly protein TadG